MNDESPIDLDRRAGPGFLPIHRNALVVRHAIRALWCHGLGEDDPGSPGWAVRVASLDDWARSEHAS